MRAVALLGLVACSASTSMTSAPDAPSTTPADAPLGPDAGLALVPVYEYFIRLNGMHFYTGDRNAGGSDLDLVRVAYYLSPTQLPGTAAFYEFFKTGCGHIYTTDPNACSDCDPPDQLGYIQVGAGAPATPLLRADENGVACEGLYTTSTVERDNALAHGFTDGGTVGYAWSCGPGDACCAPLCTGRACGADDGCGGTCAAGSGCCAPACAGQTCGADDGCGGVCWSGSGCTIPTFRGAWPDRDSKVAVTPIMNTHEIPTAADLADLRAQLGPDGPSAALGFSQETTYCSELAYSASGGWHFDPTVLRGILAAADAAGMPVTIAVNGGHWCGGGIHDPQSAFNLDKNAWRADQIAWAWLAGGSAPAPYLPTPAQGGPDYHHASTSRLFDADDPLTYRHWKRQLIEEVAQVLVAFYADTAHAPLLAGISLDSETLYTTEANTTSDYNPTFIAEWREYLQGTGIYGPGGAYAGQGRTPPLTLQQLNTLLGTSFADFSQVTPPAPPTAGAVSFAPLWHEWTRFRAEAEHHYTQDMRDWLVAGGFPAALIYNHQTSSARNDPVDTIYFTYVSDTMTSPLVGSNGGNTYYGLADDDPSLWASIHGYSERWGLFEYNPTDCLAGDAANQTADLAALQSMRDDGIDIVCPNAWPSDPNSSFCATHTGINIRGTPFGAAITAFLADPTPRPPIIDPADPGDVRVSLVTLAPGAVIANSADTHVDASASVGGVVETGIVEEPMATGTATMKFAAVAIPAVSGGKRLVLRLDGGLADAATFGTPGVLARVRFGSDSVLDFTVGQEQALWRRWRPFLADVTRYAGKTLDITLEATAVGSGDNLLVWGNPRILTTR